MSALSTLTSGRPLAARPSMPHRVAASLLATLLLVPAPLLADEAPPPPPNPSVPPPPPVRSWGEIREITLEEAYELALAGNPDLAMAEARLAQARVIRLRVAAGLQPFVNAGASYAHTNTEAVLSFGPLIQGYTDYQLYANGLQPQPLPSECPDPPYEGCEGLVALNDILTEEIVIQPQDSYSFQAQAVWQIGNARSIPLLRVAGQTIRAAEQSTEWITREILFGVSQAYYGLYTLQQVVGVSERFRESKARHVDLARARLAAGQVSAAEVMRAEVELSQAQRQLREMQQSLHGAAAEFAVLLGSPNVELRAAAPPPRVPLAGTSAQRVEAALASRPDVQAAEAQVAAARASVTDARLAFLPTFNVNGSYRWSNAAGFVGQNDIWTVGAGASWSVWDGGMHIADALEAKQRLIQAEESLRKLKMQVAKEIEVADSNVEQGEVNLRTTQEELALARRTYDQVVALYEAGLATSLELRDAEIFVSNAELNLVRSTLAVDLSLLARERAAGEFRPAP